MSSSIPVPLPVSDGDPVCRPGLLSSRAVLVPRLLPQLSQVHSGRRKEGKWFFNCFISGLAIPEPIIHTKEITYKEMCGGIRKYYFN